MLPFDSRIIFSSSSCSEACSAACTNKKMSQIAQKICQNESDKTMRRIAPTVCGKAQPHLQLRVAVGGRVAHGGGEGPRLLGRRFPQNVGQNGGLVAGGLGLAEGRGELGLFSLFSLGPLGGQRGLEQPPLRLLQLAGFFCLLREQGLGRGAGGETREAQALAGRGPRRVQQRIVVVPVHVQQPQGNALCGGGEEEKRKEKHKKRREKKRQNSTANTQETLEKQQTSGTRTHPATRP